MPNIVVLGAGVSGLTSALQLVRLEGNVVTVIAKHMPGDYDIEYTSPWAGANVLPMSARGNDRWERRSWPEFYRLAKEVPEAGIHFQKALVLKREKDMNPKEKSPLYDPLFEENPWYAEVMPDYRLLDSHELPPGIAVGSEFTSVCINTAIYLPYLVSQCLARGVVFKRAVLSHVSEAANLSHTGKKADIIVNASGLLACKLGGVMDEKVYAARGQIVLVRNEAEPMLTLSGTDDAEDELCYTMTRAAGGGTILGGTYQKDNWDPVPDQDIAHRIMARVAREHPSLTGGKGIEALDVVRHGVGLRPARTGGVRIEKEQIDGTWVVHNYGHAGWGYQGSWGCAERVVELVDEIVKAQQ